MTEQGVPTQIINSRCLFFNNGGEMWRFLGNHLQENQQTYWYISMWQKDWESHPFGIVSWWTDWKKKWICRSVESADWCEGQPDMAPWTFSTRMGPRVNRQKIYLSLRGIWDIFISRRNLTSWSSRLERLRLFSGIPAGSGNFNGDVARIPDLSGSANIKEQDISSVLRISGKYL